MTLPYFARLVCLCLASFGVVQVLAGLAVCFFARQAIGLARRLPAASGARILLLVRLSPAGGGLFAALGLCLPSFVWLEEESAAEPVSWLCVVAAVCGALFLVTGLVRAARAMARSPHLGATRKIEIGGEQCCVLESARPLFALTGVLRSRLLLSSAVLQTLSANEMSAAVSHELAHRTSRDNFKRLLLRLAPLPVTMLDHAWSKLAEWAADDTATSGDANRSLALASALVKFARLSSPEAAHPLASCLLADEFDLTARVDRLLAAPALPKRNLPRLRGLIVAAGIGAVAISPFSLVAVHKLLESLIH